MCFSLVDFSAPDLPEIVHGQPWDRLRRVRPTGYCFVYLLGSWRGPGEQWRRVEVNNERKYLILREGALKPSKACRNVDETNGKSPRNIAEERSIDQLPLCVISEGFSDLQKCQGTHEPLVWL